MRSTSIDKLLPPLVPELRKQVKTWRDTGYAGAGDITTGEVPHTTILDTFDVADYRSVIAYFAQT